MVIGIKYKCIVLQVFSRSVKNKENEKAEEFRKTGLSLASGAAGRSGASEAVTMAGCGGAVPALWLAAVLAGAAAQVLTPPYFNLAENRRITATATCGENVADPELYCKLVGANADRDATPIFIQGGQVC